MPTLWRYLLKQFFKVFFLTTISFILVLFVTRLKEIARIVALTPDFKYIFLFILNIIPYILPIAIPIASLLSVILLYQRLSHTHELTAMRCSGFSLFSLTFPILSVALFLSLVNFYVISELTTQSQLFSKKLINELITKNPFYLLEHKSRLKMRDFYVDMLIEERGKSAHHLFFITPDKTDQHLNLISIKKLEVKDDELFAPSVNIISHIKNKEGDEKRHLVIENEKNIHTSATDLAKLIKNSHFHLYPYHCSMPFLLISIRNLKEQLVLAKLKGDSKEVKKLKEAQSKNYCEISKRISIGISAFTFTLLGISFAIEIGRNRKRKNFFIMVSLTIFSLICLFTGKIFDRYFILATAIYFVPHLIILITSLWGLSRVARGIE